MRNLEIKNIKSHPSQSLAKANASRDLQINFNQAEDALTIPAESRHDYKCGSTTQRGRSMIEMLGVLAIIGVLSVGGIAGYSKAMMKYRINKTIEQITLIAGNVRTFFAPQRSYDGLNCGMNCGIVKKAKLVPDEMITGERETSSGLELIFTNAFGGGFSLASIDKSSTEPNKAFEMRYDIESDEACIELVSQDWTNAAVAAIHVVDSNREDVNLKTPVTVDNAVKYCDDRYVDYVVFYFDIDVNAEPWKTRLK